MKLLYNFLKDMKLSVTNMYFYIEIMMAVIFVIVLLFVVPENFESNLKHYIYMDLDDAYAEVARDELSKGEDEFIVKDSRAEVEAALEEDRSSIGVVLSLEDNKFVYDFILQGYEDEKLKNILINSIESAFAQDIEGYEKVTNTIIVGESSEKLSDRVNMIPVFLVMNSSFMGLFIIAAYIFADKDEGTIKAFAVTPATVWQYLLSKLLVMEVSGLITGLIAVIFIAGRNANYFHIIILLIVFNAFGSALGLFVASYFDNITKAMGWLYMLIILFGFSTVSYYMPAFSPWAIRIIPAYPMLFSFRETLLSHIDVTYIYTNVALFAGLSIIFFLLANYRFKKTLTV